MFISRTATVAALALVATFTASVGHAAPSSDPTPPAQPGPVITWTPCEGHDDAEHPMAGLECGTMPAPLNHVNPDGRTITVGMARRKASKPAERLGTLFMNPGGPGGSAVMSVNPFAQMLGSAVSDRWDIVGIDPRGVGETAPFFCHIKPGNIVDAPAFAWKSTDAAEQVKRDQALLKACATTPADPIAEFMTTADTARDMDLARQAVGENKLTYYGLSYGTYLGATYAQLFPQRVRALSLDSALDPAAWIGTPADERTVPVTERIKSRDGMAKGLDAAFAACEQAGSSCPGGTNIRDQYAAVATHLREIGPLPLDEGQLVEYDTFIWVVNGGFYSRATVAGAITTIHHLYAALPASRMLRTSAVHEASRSWRQLQDAVRNHPTGRTRPPQISELLAEAQARRTGDDGTVPLGLTFQAVICTDGVNPSSLDTWAKHSDVMDAEVPGFGPAWLWQSSLCSGWPHQGTNVYRGSFSTPTPNGLLVLNNEFDPATEMSGARGLHTVLPGSRIVEVKHGFGHGAVADSTCAQKINATYLNEGVLPATDQVCTQDHAVFPPAPTPAPSTPEPSHPAEPAPTASPTLPPLR